MKTGFKILATFGLLALMSCGKTSEKSSGHGPTPDPRVDEESLNLSAKTAEELIATKYLKAELTCDFYLNALGSGITLTSPIDTFTWDLLNDPVDELSFDLNGRTANYTTVVSLTLRDMKHLTNSSHIHQPNATYYELKHTPVLEFDVSGKTVSHSGDYIQVESHPTIKINERIPTQFFDSSMTTTPDGSGFSQRAECFFDTVPKKEFEDHFKAKPF